LGQDFRDSFTVFIRESNRAKQKASKRNIAVVEERGDMPPRYETNATEVDTTLTTPGKTHRI
jgi:hypothetical protein